MRNPSIQYSQGGNMGASSTTNSRGMTQQQILQQQQLQQHQNQLNVSNNNAGVSLEQV